MTEPRRDKKLSLLFLVLVTAVTLYLSFIIARPFLTPILTATLLAIAIYPLFLRLSRSMRNRSGAALLATVLVLIAIVLPTVLIVEKLANETTAVYAWLNEKQSLEGGWREYIGSVVDPPLQWVASRTGMSQEQLKRTALDRLQAVSTSLLNWAKSLAVNIGGTIVDTVIMLLTLFFLLRDGERIRQRIGSILPIEARRYQQLVDTISASITANIYGVLAVSVAQGTLGAIGYAIAGLPSVMLWGVATALFSMIPLAGAASVWVVASIYLLAIGSWGKAVFMLAWGAGVISTADNIVRPLVLSGRVKLHTLLIFFSLLGGVKAFGIIGLFTGPIIVSVAMALLNILEEERLEWERHFEAIKPRELHGDPGAGQFERIE
ncbi:MAG TPA: AI-2E family transporter [Bryobacteraceae bacterium]|nr:AI-2E family transporter [Bryobacteraceae bacterium]